MNNLDAWTALVVLLSPYLVALVNRPNWTRTVKRAVMVVVAVVVALGNAYFRGDFDHFDTKTWIVYLFSFVGAVQAAYTALEALPGTTKLLDKAEMLTAGSSVAKVAEQKKVVNDQAVQEFEQNAA